MRSTFRQRPEQPHVLLRRRLLDSCRSFPPPVRPEKAHAAEVEKVGTIVRAQIADFGAAIVQLDRPMSNEEFLYFGVLLGSPQPERSPTVQPFVEAEVILNLVTTSSATTDTNLQPFASNWLSLHSESSGAPPASQPRFIALLCIRPAEHATGGETVLVPMRVVLEALTPRDQILLADTHYDLHDGAPPFLRREAGRPVFSIRDFQDEPLQWVHHGAAGDPAEVGDALTRLYEAMYSTPSFGISWSRGLLVVIDNMVYFHGRAAARPPGFSPTRHLKRLRIIAPVVTS